MKKIRIITSLLLLLSVLLCSVSCMRVRAAELSAGFTGGYNGENGAANAADIYNRFAFKVFADAAKSNKNTLISPLSALACTALVTNGAGGETLAQIERFLGCTSEELNKTVYAALAGLVSGKDHKIVSASSLWIAEGFEVKNGFLQDNADYIGAQVYSAKFDSQGIKDINTWAKQKTDGMIGSAIDDLPADTVMVLMNSLLFDMKWEEKYENKDVKNGTFYNEDGAQKTVSFMSGKENIYFEAEGVTGFAKYYKNSDYIFIGLLPDEAVGVDGLISSLTAERWKDIWDSRQTASVIAVMPEFDFDDETDLSEVFKAEGVTDLFDRSKADLSKVSDEPLYCSVFKQKTRIEHSKNGTKAAAITFAGFGKMAAAAEEHYVKLDRPFVFLISDAKTGAPVFIGSVNNL